MIGGRVGGCQSISPGILRGLRPDAKIRTIIVAEADQEGEMANLTLAYKVRGYSTGTLGRAICNARTHHFVADDGGGDEVGAVSYTHLTLPTKA